MPGAGHYLEAVRIADVTPLVVDIDPGYSFQRFRYQADRRNTPDSPPLLFSVSEEAQFADLADGFVAGWETNGERRARTLLGREATLYALRFETAAQAQAAGNRIADRQAADYPGDSLVLEGFTNARSKWSVDKRSLDTWLADDIMLIGVHIDDPVSEPADPAPLIEFTRQALTTQLEMLRDYRPTPVADLDSLPADTDGLLGRTLPFEDKDRSAGGVDRSWVGPAQAALHPESRPALAASAFTDAGVDLVASAGSRLYRARDADGAVRLMAALTRIEAERYLPAQAPPNMPDAQCYQVEDESDNLTYPPFCYFAYGRIVSRVHGANTQELQQKTAAQYKLLAHGA
ncbi:hypothetical protein IU449_16880 [Nocardia higoensis]|uniref:Uncharacterized protein n=1 Tax=Nocardia higoensis TaxID=228599 RepID=A0ABS0DCJ6_9NOCA|nr:hypothetical protein [Nocardia higoensis]MBF6356196.1 hypothetical protein [Nocardia higoensis]